MHPGSRPELHINFFWLSLLQVGRCNMWAITNPGCFRDGRTEEEGQMVEVRITPRKGTLPYSHKQPGKDVLYPPLHAEPNKHKVICLDSTWYQQG